MKWKQIARDYFNFTRKEKIGVICLIFLILITWFLPSLISGPGASELSMTDTAWISEIKKYIIPASQGKDFPDSSAESEDDYNYTFQKPENNYFVKEAGELFYFDPNKLAPEDWKRLGLRRKTIQTILNYISKGGRFRKPEDLQRVYGLRQDEYQRLAPFIRIEQYSDLKNEKESVFNVSENIRTTPFAKLAPININLADTTALIALPGIGSKLAARIINFREKLGGFYRIEQVSETYGVSDSVFQKIKPYLKLDNSSLKKININTATIDQLKAHPYIKYSLANPIVAYRNEHGPFTEVADIRKVMAVTEEIFNKIAPYLVVQ